MSKTHPNRNKYVHLRVPPWKREEVPESSMNFAQERVSYLTGMAMREPLQYLLACAYLQGINDCVDAHIRNPKLGLLGE